MLFTIGQVTKMYNISHDTLRYYDKIDLLKPSVKKENGYRYYTLREIELLEIILIAKQLEIPIKDIKDIIEKEDESSYITLFENHKRLLEEKIDYLSNLKHQVQRSIEVTTQMKEFINEDHEELKEEYIDKEIIYFDQIDYGHFIDIIKDKKLMFTVENIDNKIHVDENILGIEIDDETVNEKVKHKKERYKGNYIVLTRKGNMSNIEKFICDSIEKLYKNYRLDKDINIIIIMEVMFTLLKKNKENIYFVKIYIENIK